MVNKKSGKRDDINTLLVLMKCLPAPDKLVVGEGDVQKCIKRLLKKESKRFFSNILFIKEWVDNDNEVGYRYIAIRGHNVYTFLMPEKTTDDD